jgi:hypothetical protein
MRRIWIVLLVVTSLVTMGFLVKTTVRLSRYFSLNTVVKAQSMDWKVVEKSSSSFALKVIYRFDAIKKEGVQGSTELDKPYFLNLPSAEHAIGELSKKSWDVFYNDKDPSKNSLQRNFPFKDFIQCLLTLGVFIYFLFFKKIMEKSIQEW